MRKALPVIAGLLALAVRAPAQTKPPSVYALVGARIEVGDGRVIEKGTVVLRDGVIEAVGKDIPVPPEAEPIAGDGLTVYPGFIESQWTSGLNLPEWQPDQDSAPDTVAFAPAAMREANRKGIRPELRATDCLALTDTLLSPLRRAGFTTALVAPGGGTISGRSALVNLSGLPKRDCVLRPDVTMDFSFETVRGANRFGGGGPPAATTESGTGYPGSLMGIIALLRQTLLDAAYFRTVQTAFTKGGSQRPPADDGLEALQPVLAGSMPVVFDADSENQIRRALKLSDEFGFKVLIGGGQEAWKTADVLAQRKIPVLVGLNFGAEPGVRPAPGFGNRPGFGAPPGAPGAETPGNRPQGGGRPGGRRQRPGAPNAAPSGAPAAEDTTADEEQDLPKAVIADRHRQWEEKVANAAKLQQAGVTFALTMKGTRTPTEFWQNLRRAIQAGLPHDAALQALTLNPARLFGVDKQLGTVEAGKIADLVVMTGDFADPRARVRYLFIDRSKFDTEQETAPRTPISPIPTLDTEEDPE